MIRPLLTAIIEYFLAILVIRYGKGNRKIIALVLFLLATYQLGELLIFLTNGGEIGFKVAYVATTLLPPLGILLAERILKRSFGYPIFQLISLGFVVFILFTPQIAVNFEIGAYCIRVFEYAPFLKQYYFLYYQGTLMYTMLILVIGILRSKDGVIRSVLQKMLLAYLSFDLVAILIMYFIPSFAPSSASLMCALALLAAFIFTRMSLSDDFTFSVRRDIKNSGLSKVMDSTNKMARDVRSDPLSSDEIVALVKRDRK